MGDDKSMQSQPSGQTTLGVPNNVSIAPAVVIPLLAKNVQCLQIRKSDLLPALGTFSIF